MPRHERKRSKSGIYHVMLRGINRQILFEDDEEMIQGDGSAVSFGRNRQNGSEVSEYATSRTQEE